MAAEHYDVIIVGAGIGGLSLAHRLQRSGLRVLVLEAESEVGGWARSVRHGGFLCELGPNSTFARPGMLELVSELGLSDDLLRAAPKSAKRYILLRQPGSGGTLHEVPRSAGAALRTGLLSLSEKLRLLGEPFVSPATGEDESVASFARRRFGPGFTHKVLEPALSGIWAADVEKLSVRSALPALFDYEREFGSVVLGALRSRKRSTRKRGPTISFRNGIQQLARALAAQLPPGSLQLSARACSLAPAPQGIRVIAQQLPAEETEFLANKLVLTVDARSASALLSSIAPEISSGISQVQYSPMGILHLSWPEDAFESFPEGFGFLAAPAPGRPLLGALFNSNCFEGRAPGERVLLTCFLGGAANPELSDACSEQNANDAIEELKHSLGTEVAPDIISSHFHRRAIPNFAVGHFELQKKIADFQGRQNIWLLANWLEGLGVADRVDQANRTAAAILKQVGSSARAANDSSVRASSL